MDGLTISLQLGVFAATLLLAGFAALLNRSTDLQPDWPPSPSIGRSRRVVVLTAGAVSLFVSAMVVMVLAIVVAIL